MAVTIREISEAAGVSIATVSRALNDTGHPINPETKQRIIDLAKSMGYRPNQVARSLRTDKSPIIGVIVDDITSPFTTIIVRGIQDRLKADGYFCVVINTDWDPETEQRAILDLAGHSIEGIIFAETTHQFASSELNVEDKKCVFVHRLFPTAHTHSVIPDDFYGARLAVNHLIQLGHRRIGYINGNSYYSAAERLHGYRTELELAGIPFDPALVTEGPWGISDGYNNTKQFLSLDEPPTAIFAANDSMAVGAIYAIQDSGLRVPQDIAVVGYDNREVTTIVRPSITTVTLPCFEMGQASAELLLHLINNDPATSDEIKVKGQLIIRESCGATLERQEPVKKQTSRAERLQSIRQRSND